MLYTITDDKRKMIALLILCTLIISCNAQNNQTLHVPTTTSVNDIFSKDEFTTTIVRSIEKTQPELLPYQDDMNDTFNENDHQPNVTHAVDNSNSSNTFSTNNEHGSTGTVTTNDSYPTLSSSHFDSVNVTYVILPSEFYLGQTNLITVHSREPRTKLQIFMNLTELSDTIKDESVYKLHRLDVPQNWYGLDIPYKIPFVFDHDDSLRVKLIFRFTHCLNNNHARDDDDDDLENIDQCTRNESTEVVHSVLLKQLPIVILGETDKPLYRPGESIHFRYLALNTNSLSPKSSTIPLPRKKLVIKKASMGELKNMSKTELFKLENIIYKEIYITDPMDNRVRKWVKVTPKQATNLSYTLLKTAKEGQWKVHAVIGRYKKETLEFTVKKYTLPKFTTLLETPKVFNVDSEYVQYSICAKYTNGPPLKGHTRSILCACSRYAWDEKFHQLDNEKTVEAILQTRKCPSDGYESKHRPCITHNQPLEVDGCAKFNVSVKDFALSTDKYPQWNQISILCAHVEEDGTGSKLYNCLKGDEIKFNQPTLKLEFPSVYKSKLPISGRVRLANYQKNTNYSVKVSVSEQKWGCYWRDSERGVEHYLDIIPLNSFDEAVIHIPPLHSEELIIIEAELLSPSSVGKEAKNDSEDINKILSEQRRIPSNNFWFNKPQSYENLVTDSVTLRSWDSVSKIYLQLWPPQEKIITKCPNLVKLTLLSNVRLSDKDIFIESLVRGEHLKIVIPPENGSDTYDKCVDRDDELGHYTCLDTSPEEIKCLPGWNGQNCLVPICSKDCDRTGGFCSKPGECQCKSGWTGVTCNHCVIREKCLHGKCIRGNDCVCEAGWTGYTCDRKTVTYEEDEEVSKTNNSEVLSEKIPADALDNPSFIMTTMTTSSSSTTTSPSEIDTKPVRTFYQRDIEFKIDGSWGPKFTAVIYVHHQQDALSPEVISTQLTVEKIENCSSSAIALQSESHKTSIEFSGKIVDPGQNIEMTITPQGVSSSLTGERYGLKNISTNFYHNNSQLSNEVCFVRISDISLDNFQGDKNLINLKSFSEKLTDFAMQNAFRPIGATSTNEAFQAAGFQLASTYPEPVFVHNLYPCPYLAYSSSVEESVLDDSNINGNNLRAGGRHPVAGEMHKSMFTSVKPRLRDFFPEVWLFKVFPITDIQVITNGDEEVENTESRENSQLKGVKLNLTVPDTITSWRASAYCTTKANGLWIGEPETLTVSMPFYLEITLPKEMKRGEIIHIPISVFILDRKYLQTVEEKFTSIECYEISVNVQVNSSEWLIVSTSTYSDCLCSGDKKTFLVGLLPQRLGQLNITAESLAIRKGQSCKPIEHSETDQNALIFDLKTLKTKKLQSKVLTDKIRRQINVIPEGVQHETTISDILCLNEQVTESKREFQFILPKDLIKDSLHSYIAYSDEVLGPALVNLDNLVRLPTGCGEQNMVLVAPNVYILDYLKSTPSIDSNENKAKYIQTAKSHIVSGYIQQLKYRRDDGSFSAFGKSDKEGSTWLTAFVLRVFAKAYKLEPSLSIEWGNLFNDSIKFLISRQNNETGCFEEHGKVLYSPLQGITGTDQSEWKDILLTSYVSSALFETRPENVDNNHVKYTSEVEKSYDAALKCISQNLLSHDLLDEVPTSVIVQLTHMYTLIQPNSELTVNLLNQVIKRKQVTTDQFETKAYWTEMATSESNFTISNPTGSIDNNRPRDLESTAYAFLSLNKINQSVNELFPIIRWISSQQKSNGGFYSTQDTVLGIEAIAQFAKKLGISSSLPDQNISSNVLMISNSMDIGHFTLNDSITPQKRQVINQFELSNSHLKTDNQVIHSIWKLKSNQSQRDCMLVQNTFIYNLPEVEDNKTKLKLSFNIIQQTSPIDINCKSAKLVMCLRLNARTDEKPINTGMLLIRVAMVTGWEPIIEELNSQLGIEDDSLKMITINEQNEISLYFNEFSEDEVNTLGSWEKLKRCIDVPLHQVHYVENVKNATIIANEYYTPEESVTVTYRLNECRDAWDLPETPIPTEILPVTSTESTIITDNFSETTTFKMKTPCPVCIDKVTDIQSLADSIFTSVCNYSNGFYFIKVQENINSSSINATVTHISQSRYTASWNTTLQMPNFNECPCELITTNKYIVLFFDKDTYIDQGEPVINLEELNSAATLISSEELLPSLQIAEQRWSEIEKATLNGTTDTNFSFIYECRRLPKMVKFLKSKFLN